MADQQQLIDELIDYIDKAVLKNSVSNRHVAEVLDWLNEGLKNIKLEELINIFLRKDQADSTNYLLKMFAGAQFGNFTPGISGAIINESGEIEAKSLILHSFLSVPELRYNRAIVLKGKQIISPGGGCVVKQFITVDENKWLILPVGRGGSFVF